MNFKLMTFVKNKIIIVFVLILIRVPVYAQSNLFDKTVEEVVKVTLENGINPNDLYSYIGIKENYILYFFEDRETFDKKIYALQTTTYDVTKASGYDFLLDDFISFPSINLKDNYSFYCLGVFDDSTEYGYLMMNLNYLGKDYFLDSIYNADKKVHTSFSSDGRYLLVNTLNTLSDYYNQEQDNRIIIFDLIDIDKGKIYKEYISCNLCADSYMVGNRIFFTKGRKDGYGNFSNKDIFVAHLNNNELVDTVKIASNTDIKAISMDGKYILGTRFWDKQKNTDVIVDVENKRYQMLLGRDYALRKSFYSLNKNEFVYDFRSNLIYIGMPTNYPFNALNWRNEEIPYWTEEEFWGAYEHPELKDF